MTIKFILVMNKQGRVRLSKWYSSYTDTEKIKLKSKVHKLVSSRDHKILLVSSEVKLQSNFVNFDETSKLVYKRFVGLFIIYCVDKTANDLMYLESVQLLVEVLDTYFGNVCELDLVFNFYLVYAIIDEMYLGGEYLETSKEAIIERIKLTDRLE